LTFSSNAQQKEYLFGSSILQIFSRTFLTDLFSQYLGTPVYAAVGNHESSPVNSYPPRSIYNEAGADIQWLYRTLYDSWSHWIPTEDLHTVWQGLFLNKLLTVD